MGMANNKKNIKQAELDLEDRLYREMLREYDDEFYSEEREAFYDSYRSAVEDCVDRNV